jgi:N-dimethylarginine dimethylaminohydrolase
LATGPTHLYCLFGYFILDACYNASQSRLSISILNTNHWIAQHTWLKQLINILEGYGLSGSIVEMSGLLHLKTGLSYLEGNHLLTFGDMHSHPDFSQFNRIKVEEKEAYAANSVWINGTVLVPKGFPRVLNEIKNLGYHTREVAINKS